MPSDSFVREVSEATFADDVLVQSHDLPVIVQFWAPWSGPSRSFGPLLERLTTESAGAFVLARINADQNSALAAEYEIKGLPAIKAFKDGQVVDEFTGPVPEPKLRDWLKRVAPTAADKALAQATSLLAIRQWAAAEAAFQQVLAAQPTNGPAALGLLKALLAQGHGCEAVDLVEDFPRSDSAPAAEALAPLARLLCAVESPDGAVADTDLDAMYFHSARLLARGQFEAGMDGLLDVLRQDKRYGKGEPRRVMVGLFELLGDDDPVTRQYRAELAAVLY